MTGDGTAREDQADMARIEALLEALARSPAAAEAQELVARLLSVHARALRATLARAPDAVRAELAQDDVVAAVLALHGLHPDVNADEIPAPPDLVQISVGARRRGGAAAAAAPVVAACDTCAAPIEDTHAHLVHGSDLRCVCAACASAATLPWQVASTRRARIADAGPIIDALAIPVDLAYVVVGERGIRATYPSPAGTVVHEITPAVWARACASAPALAAIARDTEALLVSRIAGEPRAFLVGVDVCFHVTATLRAGWRGLLSGDDAIARVRAELTALEAACRA